MHTSPDYKKTLTWLNTFNQKIREGGLESLFYFQTDGHNYNLLANLQMSLFSDLKRVSNLKLADYRQQKKERKKIKLQLQAWIIQGILLFLSLASLIVLKIKKQQYYLVYSIDLISDRKNLRDGRVNYLYDFLQDKGKFEVMHTIPKFSSLKNFWLRKDPIVYLESINLLASFFAPKPARKSIAFFEEEGKDLENECLNDLLNKYLAKVAVYKTAYRFWRRIFNWYQIQKVVGIEDIRYIWEILLPTKNIPSYIFQHGHYTKYHVGFLKMGFLEKEIVKPNKIVVWNNYWEQELLRLGSYFTKEEIVVGGEKDPVKRFSNPEDLFVSFGARQTFNFLIPFETDAPKDEVRKYFVSFLDSGHSIYFKLRKDMEKGTQLENYGMNKNFHPKFITIFDEKEVLDKVDFVAGVYSTFLYDMLFSGKPILILDTSMDYGEGMLINDLALKYSLGDDLGSFIQKYQEICAPKIARLGEDSLLMRDNLSAILS